MNTLNSLCAQGGISAAGVCEFCQLTPFMKPSARLHATSLVPNAASVFVVLLPYFAGSTPGNLSLYARGQDYHFVLHQLLNRFAQELMQTHSCCAAVLVDDSPLPEVQAARLAGVGKIGENGLIFDPSYGSYVFIGTILTDLPFVSFPAVHQLSAPTPPPDPCEKMISCLHCGACRQVCPLGALKPEGHVAAGICLSALTQQGGELPLDLAAAVASHPLIWGCDLCQQICPLNQTVRLTNTPAFLKDQICDLSAADVEGLTRRQFSEKYANRAFTWRGPAPLRRNLRLKEKKP